MAVGDGGKRTVTRHSESEYIENKDDMSDLEDDFSDPEDFIDNITDEGMALWLLFDVVLAKACVFFSFF